MAYYSTTKGLFANGIGFGNKITSLTYDQPYSKIPDIDGADDLQNDRFLRAVPLKIFHFYRFI